MSEQRFLLTAINAKYIHSNLAVYSLRSAAAERGFQVELAEFTINHYVEQILQELYRRSPRVLFFSCYIWNWEYVKELAAECRKIMPDTPIWVGGPEVSYDAWRVLQENPAITGVLLGEGEENFPQLLEAYCREDSFEGIDGLAFRRESGEICIRPQLQLPDLNKIPFPYGDMEEFEHKIVYYESSRGCPFSCSYCLSSIEKRVRFRDLNLVKQELGFFLQKKVPQVKFVDRTFNCRESHALEIWSYLLEHDNGVTNFHFEIGADLLTDKELALMERMRPGLIQLEIGVQSTNGRTLEEIRRGMDFSLLRQRVRQVQSFGNIHQHLDLIAGLPYEDLERFARSFDEVFALRPEQLQLGFLKVLKGSYMQEKAGDYGILYGERAPYEVLQTDWMSYADLLRLKGIEQMVEVYYNSHQFSLTLAELLKEWPSAFAFFDALATYYEKNGYGSVQHARARRYEILLDFIGDCMQKPMPELEKYRELLTFDYYLREYAKSRPAFATDITPYKEQLRRIQKVYGKDKHVEPGYFMGEARGKEPVFWLFDYENRSPLTKDAALSRVDLEQVEEQAVLRRETWERREKL